MKNYFSYLSFFIAFLIVNGCNINKKLIKPVESGSITSLKFIGEIVIPDNTMYKKTIVGGLSGIDFANGKYYVISDDKKKPVRIYEFDLRFDLLNNKKFNITDMISIDVDDQFVDPESVRYDKFYDNFLWTSEGAIRKGVNPAVFKINRMGKVLKKYATPGIFRVDDNKNTGPRQNGTFECLSMSLNKNIYWLGMELPLKEDGEEPKLYHTNSPTRISKINKETGIVEFQFAYYLDPIPKDSKPKGKFRVNGLPEILSVNDTIFLFVERAYASGYDDGGNTVKIYKVNAKNATDIKNISSLKKSRFMAAKKELLFDFESIRNKLTNGIVDNIEGITFGPTLPNGHKTLVLVSDNNFSMFNPQLNQIIMLEVIP